MLKMNDIRVGNTSILPSVNFALTDTGTSLLYLDNLDYMKLIVELCAGLDCFETEDDLFAIKGCEPAHLPTIWIQLDRHMYKLAPQVYVVSLVYGDGSHDCIIQFRQNEEPIGYAVLGTVFLTNYFQIYDVTLN